MTLFPSLAYLSLSSLTTRFSSKPERETGLFNPIQMPEGQPPRDSPTWGRGDATLTIPRYSVNQTFGFLYHPGGESE